MTDDADDRQFHQRLDPLPMAPRAAYLLHRFDGLNYGDIGWWLGLCRACVAWHLTRANLVAFGPTDVRGGCVTHMLFGEQRAAQYRDGVVSECLCDHLNSGSEVHFCGAI